MRAIQINDWCETSALTVSEVAVPRCGEREVRIEVAAAPVSFALSLLIAGRYQRKPSFPFIPGNTVAGVVVETGRLARHFQLGDRVVASLEFGGLAEQAVAHEANVYAIPQSMPFAQAVTLNTAYNSVAAAMTWPHLLNISSDDIMLILGAAGGVGTAAIEIGRHLGARIIASASSDEKRAYCTTRGAHAVIASDPGVLRDTVLDLTDGKGVTRILDPVGGALFAQALRCLRPEGRILPIGFAGGEAPSIPANLLLVKNITVCGLYMGYYKIDARDQNEDRVRALFDRLGRWFEAGAIKPHVSAIHRLDDAPEAFERLLARDNIGHVVLSIGAER